MKLGGSGWEVFDDGLVQFQCTEGDFVAQLPYDLLKWLRNVLCFHQIEMISKNGSVICTDLYGEVILTMVWPLRIEA